MMKANDPAHKGEAVECQLGGDVHGNSINARVRKPILGVRLSEEALERNIWQQVNQWDVARRVNGMVPGRRRLSKDEASAEIGAALARSLQGDMP